jgi:hypothetical protein
MLRCLSIGQYLRLRRSGAFAHFISQLLPVGVTFVHMGCVPGLSRRDLPSLHHAIFSSEDRDSTGIAVY